MARWLASLLVVLASASSLAEAQTAAKKAAPAKKPVDRDTKVRNDRKNFADSTDWIYNDLSEGQRAARKANKPLMIVFRCIPCEACQEFDDDVARRDPVIRDLLDRFVCVRIIQANAIDLTHFQYDFDQSFHVILATPDLTILGRFGTRSERSEEEDISLQGLRNALLGALDLYSRFDSIKASLAGKQARPTEYKTPRDYPMLSGRYTSTLNYEGQVAKSCIHCHQVREAERLVYRDARKPLPDAVVYPYPDPAVLGLKLHPDEAARVERVTPGSIAAKAGIEPGDRITSLAGQPLLSIADVQWILHQTGPTAELSATIKRGESQRDVTLQLSEGWRRGNISWRATSWQLRQLGLGGMKLDEPSDEQRKEAGLSHDRLALLVRHVGQYAPHDVAKRAGIKPGDIVVGFDGLSDRRTESDLLSHATQKHVPGDSVKVAVLRNGVRHEFTITLK